MKNLRVALWSRYLIYFILAVLPLERIPSFDILSTTIRLSQVAGLLLILINLPTIWKSRHRLISSPWRWLLLFWFVCLVSAGLADNMKRAITVTIFTVFVGVIAYVISLRFEQEKLHIYLMIVTMSALVTCAFGFYQFFGDLLGLSINWTGLRPQYTKDVFGFPRIQSTGLEPLYFGNYLLIPAALTIMALAHKYRQKLQATAMIAIFTVIWLAVSRGAIVALIASILAGAIFMIINQRWKQLGFLVISTAISVGLAFALLYLGTHFVAQKKTVQTKSAISNFSKQTTNVSNGESSEGRTVTRNLAFDAFKKHPLIGIGPGNFGTYASKNMPDRFTSNDAIVNNEPLELLAETGAIGLLSLISFLMLLLWKSMKLHSKNDMAKIWRYGIILALAAIALQYQTFSTLYITHVWVIIGLLAGFVTFEEIKQPKNIDV